MKKTTADFMNATPSQKETMLVDGLEYLTEQLNAGVENMKQLSNWTKCYGALVGMNEIQPQNKKLIGKKIDALIEAIDNHSDMTMVLSFRVFGTRKRVIK